MELSEFTVENTQPLVGTVFHLAMDDGTVIDLKLDRVKVLLEKHVNARLKRDSFGMYFIGPPNVYIRQGIYATHHDELGGPLTIFYVPTFRLEDGSFEFEAIFT